MKDLSRHYEQLTADERFRLFMDAAGRMDTQELDRLNGSCPQKTYRQDDLDYTRKKMWFLTMALNEARIVARLEMIGCLGLALILAHEDDDKRVAVIEPILQAAVAQRQVRMVAWDRFCHEIGVKPNAIAATVGLGDDCCWSLVEGCARSVASAPALDGQRVQDCLDALTDLWTARTGSGA